MAHVVTDTVDLKGAVFERRPHWSCDEQRAHVTSRVADAQGTPRIVDAHRREAMIAFSVVSWESMRGAVAGRSADFAAPPSAESGIAAGRPTR